MSVLPAALRRLARPRARHVPPAAPVAYTGRARELTRAWLDSARERDAAERAAQARAVHRRATAATLALAVCLAGGALAFTGARARTPHRPATLAERSAQLLDGFGR